MTAKKKNASLLVVLVVVGVGGCFFFGLVAAIAIPSYFGYLARARQVEAKFNLKSLYAAQKAHFADTNAYSNDASELTLLPGTRFTCFVTPTSFVPPTKVPAVEYQQLQPDQAPGVTGTCPDCQFTALCAGAIDNDVTLDVWSISSVDRACGKAGVPCNDVNDLVE